MFFTQFFLRKQPVLCGENDFFILKTTQNVIVLWKYGRSFLRIFFLKMADFENDNNWITLQNSENLKKFYLSFQKNAIVSLNWVYKILKFLFFFFGSTKNFKVNLSSQILMQSRSVLIQTNFSRYFRVCFTQNINVSSFLINLHKKTCFSRDFFLEINQFCAEKVAFSY